MIKDAEKAWRGTLYQPQNRYGEPTMLIPSAFYPHAECIAQHLPHLCPSQVRGLALLIATVLKVKSLA